MEQVLVVGAARSGIAAARLLRQHGYKVILTDMKPVERTEDLEGITVYDNGHPDFLRNLEYAFIVKNPGIPYHAPLIAWFKERGVPIYTEIETASWFAPEFTYGAVTGTDGKTTTVTLLLEMLKKKNPNAVEAGNIGIPLSERVLESDGSRRDIALELSNFQLMGTRSFHPLVCTVTNLAPDHLDYMDSLEEYYTSKMKIYENCTGDDWFIRNIDDENIVKYAVDIPCTIIDFSMKDPDADLCLKDGMVWLQGRELFDPGRLKIVGPFNCANAMMAAAMAFKMGVSVKDIREVLYTFPGVEHRIEYAGEIDEIPVYNDSKATNTHAACAALSAFDSNILLLCGGKDKHISFDDMKAYDSRVKHCYSFGQTKEKFADIFTRQSCHETMEEALDAALEDAEQGDVILLSPACSSFDQFQNYEVRGEIFKDLVRERMNRKDPA